MALFQLGILGSDNTEASIRRTMNAIHSTGSKVIVRQIATPTQARMLLEAGADFVCGTAPAAPAKVWA